MVNRSNSEAARQQQPADAASLSRPRRAPVRLLDLAVGMILDEDLVSPKGIRLVPMGQEVTRALIVRLTSIAAGVGVAEPFRFAYRHDSLPHRAQKYSGS